MRKIRHRHVFRGRHRSGFALAAVLWLLAGLTILAAMISQSSQTLAKRQAQLRQRADAEQDFLSTRSEALYWLASSRVRADSYGWGDQYLKVNGRGYAGVGKSVIQVQDTRGLLGLNRPNRDRLGPLLLRCGATQSQIDSLLDALQDYQEPGNLKRLNGAKALEYIMAGMPPPRGAPLAAEPEIWQVYGWKALQPVWEEKHCFEDVTVHGDSGFNIGTATAGVLTSYGLSGEQTDQLLRERESDDSGLMDILTARDRATSFMGMGSTQGAGQEFRVTQSMPGMPWVLRYDLKLTTDVEGRPWELSAPRRLPLPSVMIPAGRAAWPQIDEISETELNAITQPKLPF